MKEKLPSMGNGEPVQINLRVSRWWGVRALSAILLVIGFGLVTVTFVINALNQWMTPEGGAYRAILIVVCIIIWGLITLIYNQLWVRSVTLMDQGSHILIQINHNQYLYEWSSLKRVKTAPIRSRHGAVIGLRLILVFRERTFRFSTESDRLALERIAQYFRDKLEEGQGWAEL